MRADRIVELLLLLQARGQMTARELATELEVSERTVYRDIDALTLAGIPIYAEAGTGGGYRLLDEYRTDLTGLTTAELRALVSLSVPAPLRDLGIAEELRSALRKLAAAASWASESRSLDTQQRVHMDFTAPVHDQVSVPHLQTIHTALWDNQMLRVVYTVPYAPVTVALTLAPYGLVAQSGVWHLVCHHHQRFRVYKLTDLAAVESEPAHFERQPDFDLVRFWQSWLQTDQQDRPVFQVVLRVHPEHYAAVARRCSTRLTVDDPTLVQQDDGTHCLTLQFSSQEEARAVLMSYGGAVEVLRPRSLRLAIADYAEQIRLRYQE